MDGVGSGQEHIFSLLCFQAEFYIIRFTGAPQRNVPVSGPQIDVNVEATCIWARTLAKNIKAEHRLCRLFPISDPVPGLSQLFSSNFPVSVDGVRIDCKHHQTSAAVRAGKLLRFLLSQGRRGERLDWPDKRRANESTNSHSHAGVKGL